MAFINFWKWYSREQVLKGGQRVVISSDKLEIHHSGKTSPYSISKPTAQTYFYQCSKGGISPSSYFNSCYKTFLSSTAKKPPALPPIHPSTKPTIRSSQSPTFCRCFLSRTFLFRLLKRKSSIPITSSTESQWPNMVINKGSYVPAKLKSEYRITLSKKDKSLIEDALLNTVGGLRKGNNFNAEWRKCNNAILLILSRTGAYPIGCSQKLINLLMKYYYAYYYAEIDREWMAKNHWVNRVAIDMDIPIDSIVLKSLRQTKYSYHATRITGGQTPKLFCKKHPPQSWSQLNCMKCYQDLQKFCKQHAAASGYIDAMEFEMTELWP